MRGGSNPGIDATFGQLDIECSDDPVMHGCDGWRDVFCPRRSCATSQVSWSVALRSPWLQMPGAFFSFNSPQRAGR